MESFMFTISAPRQRLVAAMQRNPFSNIELVVSGGEPLFDPLPKVTREIRLGVGNPVRPTSDGGDFGLKKSVSDLFDHFDRLRDFTAVTIEVRHGLPARLIVAGEV